MADRISSLPDTILCDILSLLQTKEAVATSVLSKRWKPLWRSVSTLHFNDQSYSQNNETYFRFLHLVYAAMLLRKVTQPILRFNLDCVSSLCDPSVVNTWVMAAIQRKVKCISLSLPSTINLPSCILTSTTLVVLKLTGLSVNHVSSIGLPSLKTLQLKRVNFVEHRYLSEILSACPLLEDFQLSFLDYTNLLVHGGDFNKLPNLIKADVPNSVFPLEIFYNVGFLSAHVGLLSSSYAGNQSFLNLTYLELILLFHEWYLLIELLHHCPNLQVLVIEKIESSFDLTTVENETWVYPKSVPDCLSSGVRRCCVQNYKGHEGELQFVRYIMQNAKVLCALTIHSTTSSTPEAKLQMLKMLSLCPRISVTSELSFE